MGACKEHESIIIILTAVTRLLLQVQSGVGVLSSVFHFSLVKTL